MSLASFSSVPSFVFNLLTHILPWTMHTQKDRARWPAPWPSRPSRKTPCLTTPQITHRSPTLLSVPPSPFFTHTEQNGRRLGPRDI